ncbi:aldehyde dehydrogenase family protein [Mycobacteroides abscessus]|uniref:aldehyde dehydrogenase family protein n=1 Tax=Mycobacteroides abscessus TaxID=36809 RepID=UPI0009A66925|nr:aldehyde dehydrogenase family protein [Mycobacteroides abscessus]MBL3750906.1 aldehyde dehydrogenase family protein [Mycobacteroides abscessus subsp. massiliense]SKE68584.1 Probable aldehyde dehydrogenase [Mycobacteroides abscessus subsp. massiliense]SKH68532.1 Probable aldehyde dehydrogenase [Mycobacteroides abscessus subsp. massiliense]SKI34842.1 Probable aldehyde dehydrogenase [Mycobacteroides abscessus subsp. massiliense]SKJ34513.1 Probable aldehyde dehydrogenase [Mycobacteroides absces
MHTNEIQSFMGGRWISGGGQAVISVCPAFPDRVIAEGLAAGPAEFDEAAAAARAAQPGWAAMPLHERGAILSHAAAVVDRNADAWGLELAAEEGKTKAEGIAEVRRAAQILRYYGNEGDRQTGEIFSSPRRGEHILVTRKPLGVVGVITPFNFPIAIPAWKIAPALVYGNAVLWKPASTVPLLAMRLAQAFEAAGVPAGVLNLVVGDTGVGDAMVNDSRVDAVTFTGSTGVGRRIAAAGAARGIPVQAEMGGKNAAVVLDDADVDLAVEQVLLGAFRSTGQKCTATSRLILTEGIADAFLSLLKDRADALVVGDPTAEDTQMGPVVSESAFGTITAGIGSAVAQGAVTLAGGHGYGDGPLAAGYFIAPTIMELGMGTVDLWTEELFGPVLAVRRAADTEEAFRLTNDSEYGLSAAIFTRDLTRALSAVDHLDVGILHVNSESAGADPHVPFGGAKKSGLGPKEQGRAAREFFTHTTTVYLRGGEAL